VHKVHGFIVAEQVRVKVYVAIDTQSVEFLRHQVTILVCELDLTVELLFGCEPKVRYDVAEEQRFFGLRMQNFGVDVPVQLLVCENHMPSCGSVVSDNMHKPFCGLIHSFLHAEQKHVLVPTLSSHDIQIRRQNFNWQTQSQSVTSASVLSV